MHRFQFRDADAETSQLPSPTKKTDAILLPMNHQANINKSGLRALNCGWDSFTCRLTGQCIPNNKVCDSVVNCHDASDETQCTCVSRLKPNKLCDGYIDCPDASDEVGCFGCAHNEMSCYRDHDEFIESNQQRMCYSKLERCDGIQKCANGKDEEDCSRILLETNTVRFSSEFILSIQIQS